MHALLDAVDAVGDEPEVAAADLQAQAQARRWVWGVEGIGFGAWGLGFRAWRWWGQGRVRQKALTAPDLTFRSGVGGSRGWGLGQASQWT